MRGQGSTEFVILAAFMILVLIVFTIIVQYQILSARGERNQALTQQLANVINTEELLAASSHSGYQRDFFLPVTIDSSPYKLRTESKGYDLVIGFRNKDYVYFLDHNATIKPLKPGLNTIKQ